MKYEQPNIPITADKYYLPYHHYAQQQQDDWLQPHHHLPDGDKLRQHSSDVRFEGQIEKYYALDPEQLPTLKVGDQFAGPTTIENEIIKTTKLEVLKT